MLTNGSLNAAPDANESWRTVAGSTGSPRARHEASGAAVDGKFYLMGGRGSKPIDVYDVATDTWSTAADPPIGFSHFQVSVLGTDIYVIGAFVGSYPNEDSVAEIHVLDTVANEWRIVGEMPEGRVRGSVATAVRGDWIYVHGGNTQGHNGGAVPWFDRYNAVTGDWEVLPDAPEARDHHSAAWLGDAFVTSGGRRSVQPNPFANTVGPTDVYQNGAWTSEASIPTERAGALTVGYENELIVVGGENATDALDVAEAFDVVNGTWRNLQSLNLQRHSGGAAIIGSRLHVVAGATGRGGAGETASHETLELDSGDQPDSDNDGLSDFLENEEYGTDPLDFDTDDDQLGDGEEASLGTDPLDEDTDDDGLDDYEETIAGTNPSDPDSDDDGLADGFEVDDSGSDPLLADTDEDGLDDANELNLGTDPTRADTDEDGVNDGDERDAGTDPLVFDDVDDGAGDDGAGDEGAGDDVGSNDSGTDDAGTDDVGTDDAGTDDAGTDDVGSDDVGTDDGEDIASSGNRGGGGHMGLLGLLILLAGALMRARAGPARDIARHK